MLAGLPMAGPYGRVRLPVCDTVRSAIAENRLATLRGEGHHSTGMDY